MLESAGLCIMQDKTTKQVLFLPGDWNDFPMTDAVHRLGLGLRLCSPDQRQQRSQSFMGHNMVTNVTICHISVLKKQALLCNCQELSAGTQSMATGTFVGNNLSVHLEHGCGDSCSIMC